MLINRKNIVICSMILLLFIVGYVYNSFTASKISEADFELKTDGTTAVITDEQATESSAEQNKDAKGEVIVVEDKNEAAVEAASSSFFSEYRLERDKNRSKEVEMWQDIINSDNTEETFKNQAQQELVKIVALTEKEMIIENLIISRGFNDALVFLADDSATVIVEAKELTPANVAQIQDIVVRKANLNPGNIKIMKKS